VESIPTNRDFGASNRYQRHQPENTPLYPIVEQHLPTLRDDLQRHENSLPRFVLSEFKDYLRCGRLEYGFVRVKCNGCRHEHLVAFSCKRRGFCPSCGARRMIETSAHLVDHVFPEVPVRQWVLSFPWPLRLLFASRPDALGRCLSVIIRAIQTDLAHRAGLAASSSARTGVVTLIQRFGSALNLNIHLHMLILDGVYTLEQNGPRFRRVGAPQAQTLERLLNRLIHRILRRLTRDGLLIEDPEQPWLDLEPADTLDHLNAASIRYRVAVGQGAGGKTLTLKNPALARADSEPKPFTANRNGFSLNCAVACQAHQRDRLERLCRYIMRPALCLERLSTNAAGQVVYQLKNPFRDGTTHILFSPQDFVARLAALVPRPRSNLIRYHGVFAPGSPMRQAIVPTTASLRQRRKHKGPTAAPATLQSGPAEPPINNSDTPTAPLTWAQRLKRVFEIDITLCPFCGGQLRVIADITDPELIAKILDHVHSRAPPGLPPARAEPRTTPLDLFGEP
jgi:ribosomal protein S27E